MRIIKQYGIITASGPGELAGAVNKCIGEGWQPYGPPMLVRLRNDQGQDAGAMQQAMVIYEPAIALAGAIQ